MTSKQERTETTSCCRLPGVTCARVAVREWFAGRIEAQHSHKKTHGTPESVCTMHCMTTESEAKEFARQWVAAWNSHDLDAIMSHYDADVVLTSPVASIRNNRRERRIAQLLQAGAGSLSQLAF